MVNFLMRSFPSFFALRVWRGELSRHVGPFGPLTLTSVSNHNVALVAIIVSPSSTHDQTKDLWSLFVS